MAKHPDYPGVSSMTDRHGKERWRFRRSGHKDVMLPGEPHSPEFDGAYQAAVEGRTVKLPTAANPESLKAAYAILRQSREWRDLGDKTRTRDAKLIEAFLAHGGAKPWGDGPVSELRHTNIEDYLETYLDVPHVERRALLAIRKLVQTAIRKDWIAADPTYAIKRNPATAGWPAWSRDMMDAYERRWPIGTPQRTAYALGLWMGNRASDVARLRWDHLVTKHSMIDGKRLSVEGFEFIQHKTRKRGEAIFLPLTPMLGAALAPLDRSTGHVLLTARGNPYSDNALTQAMVYWATQAGLPAGYSMHGLRKALGVKLAEADATTREIMEVLGHSSIQYAELYTREADKTRLAVKGMEKMATLERAIRRPDLKVVR
jgi:integrase